MSGSYERHAECRVLGCVKKKIKKKKKPEKNWKVAKMWARCQLLCYMTRNYENPIWWTEQWSGTCTIQQVYTPSYINILRDWNILLHQTIAQVHFSISPVEDIIAIVTGPCYLIVMASASLIGQTTLSYERDR